MVEVVAEVGVEETEVDSAEVAGAVTQVSVVVEVEVEETFVAVVVEVVGISEAAVETLEVEAAVTEASTAVEVGEVAVAAVLGNREGTWSFLSIFPSNLI